MPIFNPVEPDIIDDFKETGLLKLGPGDFSVNQTINLGTMSGVRVEGAGMVYQPNASSNDKQVTRLHWEGPPNEPMIQGYIRQGLFKDIQFNDGWIWIEAKSGFGTGVSQFERCTFFGANSKVLFGGAVNANAADSRFRCCQWVNCDTCIELSTAQNVNYAVVDSMFYRCGTVFDIPAGGLINFDSNYMTRTPIIFNITGNGSQIGSQNANFSVTNIRYDAQQDSKPVIVKDRGSYGSGRELFMINPHAPPIGLDYVDTANAEWSVLGLNVSKVDVMSTTPQAGQEFFINVSMLDRSTGEILSNPTIEAADFKISTDGKILTELINTPVVKPPRSGIVNIHLTESEVGNENFTIVMRDVAGSQWKTMNYHESVSDLTTVTQPASSIHTTSIIASPVQATIVEGQSLGADLINKPVLNAELI